MVKFGPSLRESFLELPGRWTFQGASEPWRDPKFRYRIEARIYGDRKWYTARDLYRIRYDHALNTLYQLLIRLECYNVEVRLIDHRNDDLELRRVVQLFPIADNEPGARLLPGMEFIRDYLPMAPPEAERPFSDYQKYGPGNPYAPPSHKKKGP